MHNLEWGKPLCTVIWEDSMMHRFGLLKITVIGGFLLLAVAFIFIFGRKENYEKNQMDIYIEEKRAKCGISICTPCQFLETDEKAELEDYYIDGDFHIIHHSKFPQSKPTQLEILPASGKDKIDRIIHQSWKSKMIPVQFKDYIKSFVENHLSWKYMFWTDQSSRLFIRNNYPNLLSLYDNYAHPLNRPDAIRYIILFHFGGVYSDLDVQSLHPLDPIIKKYSCILGQEPHVHSIVYTNFYGQASNAFMACRKQHPFMKSVVENLLQFYYFANVLDSTGPRFLTFSLRQYKHSNRDMEHSDDNYVYLAPPEYFLPTVDPEIKTKLEFLCGGFPCLSSLRQWMCEQWKQEGVRTEPYPFSFTNHVWAHVTYKDIFVTNTRETYIFEICPDAIIYEHDNV